MVGPMKYHFKNTTMKLSLLTKAIFTIVFLFLTKNNIFAQTKYQKDFYEFWSDINKHYAYLERQNIDWNKVKEIYSSQVEKVKNDNEFIQLLENTLNELYNGHSSLSTNLNTSNRIIPSWSDLRVEKNGNKYLIKDLRKGFGADLAGLKIGMQVTLFNGKAIDEQLKSCLLYTSPSPRD